MISGDDNDDDDDDDDDDYRLPDRLTDLGCSPC